MKLGIFWKTKGIIQLILSIIPFGIEINHFLQKIRGGYSEEQLLKSALKQAKEIQEFNKRKTIKSCSVLEIGPGWSLVGIILFHLKGASKIYGFDLFPHASFDISKRLIKVISQNSKIFADELAIDELFLKESCKILLDSNSKNDLFSKLNLDYYSPGDARYTNLKSKSIDIIFSYGVFEHIPTKKLCEIFKETKRVLKDDGRQYHNIGLGDHFIYMGLGNGVNFLRYPNWYWFLLTGNSISYHNRLRISDYKRIFKKEELKIVFEDKELLAINLETLKSLPLNISFHGYENDDLAASAYYVDLEKYT
tara:strand:+ start:16983 stop:17906 length:924 start_codon:yes stop_codon:yes gene_type:complete